MLAVVARLEESWFLLAPQPSAHAEAALQDRLLAAMRAAAEAGCERVWLSAPRGFAAEQESLRLAVSVALHCASLRVVAAGLRRASWIRLAEDAATADGLCGGRLELAFEELPDAAMLARLREAWSGAPVLLDSDPASEPGGADRQRIELHPRPVRPDGPPLWAEASSPEQAARAAELELGAIVADPASALAHLQAAYDVMPPPIAIVDAASSELPQSLSAAIGLSRISLE